MIKPTSILFFKAKRVAKLHPLATSKNEAVAI